MPDRQRGVVKPPNETDFKGDCRTNGFLPLSPEQSPFTASNHSRFRHGDAGGSADLCVMRLRSSLLTRSWWLAILATHRHVHRPLHPGRVPCRSIPFWHPGKDWHDQFRSPVMRAGASSNR